MPRKPRIDSRSEDVVLFYTGDGPVYGDAPARDLNGADLLRLARIEALRASGGEPVASASVDELEALADRLASSGAFSRSSDKPSPEVPDAPAEKE